MSSVLFNDRYEAGEVLARFLGSRMSEDSVLVLALPRGGLPVAFPIAKALSAPLDVFLVRKLGVPGHEELAMGAVASGGIRVLNEDVVEHLGISERVIEAVAREELAELQRREHCYRGERPDQGDDRAWERGACGRRGRPAPPRVGEGRRGARDDRGPRPQRPRPRGGGRRGIGAALPLGAVVPPPAPP